MDYTTETALEKLAGLKGFIAAAVGHGESGMTMGARGGATRFNTDIAVAINSEVVKAKVAAAKALEIEGGIEDMRSSWERWPR